MDRRRFLTSVGAGGVTGLAGCPVGPNASQGDGSDSSSGDGRPPFRVSEVGFERRTADGYDPIVVRGLNIGMAKPGAFPGQAAITRAEYDRWLTAIGDIANVIRTYTIHPPAFYRALAAYNESADTPLFLLQGTWVPTRDLLDGKDATKQSSTIDRELRRTVDVLHGATTLPQRPGHASGTYDADMNDRTLGLLFGIEWPPEVVAATNAATEVQSFSGEYLRAEDASAFERWLAGRLDHAVAYETETYGVHRPAGFVNWVTTDPLEHPYEPFQSEDSVSVDPDVLAATAEFQAGTYAAYHAYPYYPDLLNETPSYINYVDHRGERNSYAGYLNDLATATEHPLLIAEFGVPSSRGIAHRHVHGRDQGRHTEATQGALVAAMYEDIVAAETAGGIAFTWQDEWFKRTWNLDARSVPGRRPYWSNIETPEQRFGLLSFEPADGISLSGTDGDWVNAKRMPVSAVGDTTARTLETVRVSHDYEGLGVRLEFDSSGDPIDWTATNALVTFGLTDRTTELPFGTETMASADFLARLAGPTQSKLLVEASYDAFAREFGAQAGLDLEAYRSGEAGFVPVREPINLGYTVPPTNERVPFEAVETGELRYGNGDPTATDYDSLTDVYVDPAGQTVELKLPWVLLNVADPSSKRRIQTDWESGLGVTEFEGIDVGVVTYAPAADGTATGGSGGSALDRAAAGVDGNVLQTRRYEWERWNQLDYEERLKDSYEVLRRSGWDTTI